MYVAYSQSITFKFRIKSTLLAIKVDMDSRFYCCCGPFRTHVEKGAMVIAVFGAFMNCVWAFAPGKSATSSADESDTRSIVMYFVLHVLLFLSIIVAIRERKSWLFLPYLIIEAIVLCSGVLTTIILVIVAFTEDEGESAESKRKMQYFIAGLFVAYCLILALNFWFYTIIYRAYKFVDKETWNAGTVVATAPPAYSV